MQFTDVTGLAGCAIAIVALAAKVPGVSRLSRTRRRGLLAAVFFAALLPVGALPLAGYVRGATGDLSIASLLLLGMGLLRALHGVPMPPDRNKLLSLIVLVAIAFYPWALGWSNFDPYRLGYGSYWLLAGLLGIALLSYWQELPTVALAIGLAVLAWSTGWYESANLWDYLLDPLVSIYAAMVLATQGIRRLRRG